MSEYQDRQLAAIMFTDIVGYTKLMQKSESTAMLIRQRHRDIFETTTRNFGGQIIQYYGDGTLSIFKSTVTAVKCGVELQKQFLEQPVVPLRIGIHTGDIILKEADIIGDSVNVAARIESLGVAGSVLVSAKVAGEIKNHEDLPVKHLGSFHFKNVEKPMDIYALAVSELMVPKAAQLRGKLERDSKRRNLKSFRVSKLSIALILALIVVISSSLWFYQKQSKVKWATHVALPKLEELIYDTFGPVSNTEAYHLAREAAKYIPGHERLQQLLELTASRTNVITEPEGVDVYMKPYQNPEQDWEYLGQSPLHELALPKGLLRWKMEKEGFETVYAVDLSYTYNMDNNDFSDPETWEPNTITRKLDQLGSIPSEMVRVNGGPSASGELGDFLIDRYEVSNRQFKNFMTNGGYQDQKYWKHEFVDEEKILSWQEAMSRFVDQTGQSGPANWEAGDFPDGQDEYPVRGISWYEAAAFAAYAGKSLPTMSHWYLARGGSLFSYSTASVAPFSNYSQEGPIEVGQLPGITAFGAYDMAGNVREWCWNQTDNGRLVRGGAWSDNTYSFGNRYQVNALDRSATNGFRCAVYLEPDSIPERAFEQISVVPRIHYDLTPVSEEIFSVYRDNFIYDKKELQSETLVKNETHDHWLEEKVAFNAAYDDEEVKGYLFLPKSAVPPYQAIVYWPGSGSLIDANNYESIINYYEFPLFLESIVKTGRAVFYPVYKGTFERHDPTLRAIHIGRETREFTDYLSILVQDLQRSIDYLESRGDIDTSKIALYGMSWGSVFGPVAAAVDDRIKTNIFVVGGLDFKTRPEAFPLNYLPRVTQPTIMLNGRFDARFSLEDSVKPMFELLGCEEEEKKLILFDSGHVLPQNQMTKEVLAWLELQLGPVKRLAK